VGAAVLFLAGGERAIHGTNNPGLNRPRFAGGSNS